MALQILAHVAELGTSAKRMQSIPHLIPLVTKVTKLLKLGVTQMKDFTAFQFDQKRNTSETTKYNKLLRIEVTSNPSNGAELWKIYLSHRSAMKVTLPPRRLLELQSGATLASIILTMMYEKQHIVGWLKTNSYIKEILETEIEVLNTMYYILSVRPVVLYS